MGNDQPFQVQDKAPDKVQPVPEGLKGDRLAGDIFKPAQIKTEQQDKPDSVAVDKREQMLKDKSEKMHKDGTLHPDLTIVGIKDGRAMVVDKARGDKDKAYALDKDGKVAEEFKVNRNGDGKITGYTPIDNVVQTASLTTEKETATLKDAGTSADRSTGNTRPETSQLEHVPLSQGDNPPLRHIEGNRQSDKANPVKDLASEKAHLTDSIKGLNPEEHKAFTEHMEEFQKRAKERQLPDAEVAGTYHEISRILDEGQHSPLPQQERQAVAEQVMRQAADPGIISQGDHKTCNVAVVEVRLYTENPSDAARLVADVTLSGGYTAGNGAHVENIDPRAHDKESQQRIAKDGERSHASEIFQITAVNIAYQMDQSDGPRRYGQVAANGDGDNGERLWNMSTSRPSVEGKSPGLNDSDQASLPGVLTGKHQENVMIANSEVTDSLIRNNDGQVLARDSNGQAMRRHSDEKPGGDGPYHIASDEEIKASKEELKKQGLSIIENEHELKEKLQGLKDNGQLPVTLRVNCLMEPLYNDSGDGKTGGSGGWHVVTITDIEGDKVKFDNQWQKGVDHTDDSTSVKLHDVYLSTLSADTAITELEKDQAANNDFTTEKQAELLRLITYQHQQQDHPPGSDEDFSQLKDFMQNKAQDWRTEERKLILTPSAERTAERAHGLDEIHAAITNFKPADQLALYQNERQYGLISQEAYADRIVDTSLIQARRMQHSEQESHPGEVPPPGQQGAHERATENEEYKTAFKERVAALTPKDREQLNEKLWSATETFGVLDLYKAQKDANLMSSQEYDKFMVRGGKYLADHENDQPPAAGFERNKKIYERAFKALPSDEERQEIYNQITGASN